MVANINKNIIVSSFTPNTSKNTGNHANVGVGCKDAHRLLNMNLNDLFNTDKITTTNKIIDIKIQDLNKKIKVSVRESNESRIREQCWIFHY
jgi:hypothetical protein